MPARRCASVWSELVASSRREPPSLSLLDGGVVQALKPVNNDKVAVANTSRLCQLPSLLLTFSITETPR
jgi:hypothetical protein